PPGGRFAAARAAAAGWSTRGYLAVYAASAVACCALAATGHHRFVDLRVYQMGGRAALHGANLYNLRFRGLPFTYPPFPAVLFSLVSMLPWLAAAVLMIASSAVLLPAMLYLALRLEPLRSRLGQRDAWRVALAAAAAAIWLEPVRSALGYGQVDLFLAAAVLYDLVLPDTARRKGVAIGLTAGIKLTPAIFVIYLLVTRRFRAAATATAVLAATVAVGFAALPGSSVRYWDGTFVNPRHISPVQDPQNQSLLGVMARTLHTPDVEHLWLPVALLVAVAGLGLAAAAQRRGDEAAGFCLCAITGLLISPISWTHHWVIAVPGLVIAAVAIHQGRIRPPLARGLGAAALTALAVIGWGRLARRVPGGSHWLNLPAIGLADSMLYVLVGLAALTLAAWLTLANQLSRHRALGQEAPTTLR
ncbi:MAG: glycosyltransferase 87 family protein, partial [Streptosporangiaceae bacterium]